MTIISEYLSVVLNLNSNIALWYILQNVRFEFISLPKTAKPLIIDVSKMVSQVFIAFKSAT